MKWIKTKTELPIFIFSSRTDDVIFSGENIYYYNKAQKLLEDYNFKGALKLYFKILENELNDLVLYLTYFHIGYCFYKLDNIENALINYSNALKKGEQIKNNNNGTFKYVNLKDIYLEIALCYIKRNNFIQANNNLKTAFELSNNSIDFYTRLILTERRIAFELAIKYGEFFIDNAKKIISNKMFYFHLGYAYRRLNKFEKAINYYRKAFEINKSNASIITELAMAIIEFQPNTVDFLIEALDLLKNIFKIKNPIYHKGHTVSDDYYHIGIIYQHLGFIYNKEHNYIYQSIYWFEKSIKSNPSFPHSYTELSRVLFFIYKISLDRTYLDKALIKVNTSISLLEKYNKKDSYKKVLPYIARAKIYLVLNENNNAIKDLIVAQNINPHSDLLYSLLGLIYFDRKEIQKSICFYRLADNISPNNIEILFKLGLLYNEWNERINIDDSVFKNFIKKSDRKNWENYISEKVFNNRKKYSIEYYKNVFPYLFIGMTKYMNTLDNEIDLSFFIDINTASKYLIEMINEKYFKFSNLNEYWGGKGFEAGDIKDGAAIYYDENIPKEFKDATTKNVRVRSFSNTIDINKMNYLFDRFTKQKGVALIISIKKEWLLSKRIYANKVIYRQIKEIKVDVSSPVSVIQTGLYSKEKEFEGENEFRLSVFDDFGDRIVKVYWNYNDKYGNEIKEENYGIKIKEILFAPNYNDNTLKTKIIKLAKECKIKVYETELDLDLNLIKIKVNKT